MGSVGLWRTVVAADLESLGIAMNRIERGPPF